MFKTLWDFIKFNQKIFSIQKNKALYNSCDKKLLAFQGTEIVQQKNKAPLSPMSGQVVCECGFKKPEPRRASVLVCDCRVIWHDFEIFV